ncbi:hypothetical protein I4F81_001630 [Pyropia yezoensis]|uniref:Uncharacterized protein n=1 Tax=Pyropia yezoensis TaxID=2788 RepID=A0ACC3BNF5_PYRYE|nr:hypothetical protein I4F81_001630 [Neopyropia yezoensis]
MSLPSESTSACARARSTSSAPTRASATAARSATVAPVPWSIIAAMSSATAIAVARCASREDLVAAVDDASSASISQSAAMSIIVPDQRRNVRALLVKLKQVFDKVSVRLASTTETQVRSLDAEWAKAKKLASSLEAELARLEGTAPIDSAVSAAEAQLAAATDAQVASLACIRPVQPIDLATGHLGALRVMVTRAAAGAYARQRRRVNRGSPVATAALIACAVAAAAVPVARAQSTCSAYLDLTSFFVRTTLQVDPRNEDDIIPLNNVLYSNSKTPIEVHGGSRLLLTVRIETPGNKTRNALAAAVVLDLPGGRTRRILTDTSWRWSPARSTSGTRAAQLHSVALTEEYYPSGAQWITEPDGRLADVYWTTFAKTLPRGVCAEVVSGPSQIPGVVSAGCPSGDSKWGIIVAAVLGVLSLLALVAAGAALFMLRRMRRRLPPDEKRDNG